MAKGGLQFVIRKRSIALPLQKAMRMICPFQKTCSIIRIGNIYSLIGDQNHITASHEPEIRIRKQFCEEESVVEESSLA